MTDDASLPSTESPVVLVVEDDSILRDLLVEVVTGMGAVVHSEDTVDNGLRALQDHPELNLVITDVVTPGSLNGWELAQEVHEHHPGVPVLITSGFTSEWFGQLPPGARFISKPWTLDEICNAVSACLEAT
ncbi:response regulator [Pseudomonas typographi]|uniref:response regulator n=1 Tax=Pseudomonas typographi TaxID=2715964 RepID=UPI001682B2C8|nr:response regulator [Pseudomonas typographi]MBD1590329.1 response regulator [Pseudomonas typographi]